MGDMTRCNQMFGQRPRQLKSGEKWQRIKWRSGSWYRKEIWSVGHIFYFPLSPRGLWWSRTVVLCLTPGPSGPSQACRDGAELWGFCGVCPVSLLTCQSNSVMFTMGYFLLMQQSASSTSWPFDIRQLPSFSRPALPQFHPLVLESC